MQVAPYPVLVKPAFTSSVGLWLLLCLALITVMVGVGGYTRLSGSGLSIVEWKPIHGSIPPLNAEEWTEEFEKYKTIPQYQQVNKGMSLEEFKAIFWPEFWHRNLGRLIGLVYALPLFYFLARGAFSPQFARCLLVILLLGGAQGGIGWVMVASGLEGRIRVDHIKLAMHFGMAMLLAGAIFWTWLQVKATEKPLSYALVAPGAALFSWLIVVLVFAQLLVGALVAGLHAGLIYNSFPLMNGQWIADDVFAFQGAWFDHVPLVQFIHRWLAKLLLLLALGGWAWQRRHAVSPQVRMAANLLILLLFGQFILGVLTLVNAVPLLLGVCHQLGGFFVLLSALNLAFYLGRVDNNAIQTGAVAVSEA